MPPSLRGGASLVQQERPISERNQLPALIHEIHFSSHESCFYYLIGPSACWVGSADLTGILRCREWRVSCVFVPEPMIVMPLS